MKLGDVGNADAVGNGKPLDGVRVLAAEQMQAVPYSTQLLARLGADVVKVEHPTDGESGRGAHPSMTDPTGRQAGATFLRNNLNKRSIGIDLKAPAGKKLFLDLVPHFDVVAENFRAGTMKRLGIGYDTVSAVHPGIIYASVSGFGNTIPSPYDTWAAYASIAEGMSGIYDYMQGVDEDGNEEPPIIGPAGALGDISSALFMTIGVLAALRHRDRTGVGQQVDIAMLDAMVAMSDIVPNYWSMGLRPREGLGPLVIFDGFKAKDGWFVVQVGREHQFERLANLIGTPEWLSDPRFSTREGWITHLQDVIRPAVEDWASTRTKLEAAFAMNAEGIASGPINSAPDVIADPHVEARNMLVSVPRTDDVEEPILLPGNPVKLSMVAEGPETRWPWVGEHTEAILRDELTLSDDEIEKLRADGVIN
jgi:crotonobetainyl-CoA:carnitine CoA-transferase CaiB-like acyl-CoA transferase